MSLNYRIVIIFRLQRQDSLKRSSKCFQMSQSSVEKPWFIFGMLLQPFASGLKRSFVLLKRCLDHSGGCSARPVCFTIFVFFVGHALKFGLSDMEEKFSIRLICQRPFDIVWFFLGLVFFEHFKRAAETEVVNIASLGSAVCPTSTRFYCWWLSYYHLRC